MTDCAATEISSASMKLYLGQQNRDRYVAILDKGTSSFAPETELSLVDALPLLFLNPAVFFRMPACSYAIIEVHVKLGVGDGEPRFSFDFQVFHARDLSEEAIEEFQKQAAEAGSKIESLGKADSLSMLWEGMRTDDEGTTYVVNCPPGTPFTQVIECPDGQEGACVDNGSGGHVVRCINSGAGD